jgi:hypothetical protein
LAVTSLQLTYTEIRSHMALMAPFNRDTANWSADMTADMLLCLRGGLRKAYYPPVLREGETPHQWSFLRPDYTLTTNVKYDTGTITVVNGAVTLSGGTFPSWALHGWLVYGGKYYEVASGSFPGTSMTLVDTSAGNDSAAGTTYELLQYRFVLPNDFESLEGPMYWSPDQSLTNTPLVRRSDNYLRMLYQDSATDSFADEPKFYALVPYTTATTAIQTWAMLIWPAVTSVVHFKFRYNLQMSDLDATNAYPPGGAQHSEMILESCLSEVELKYNDAPGPHTEKWLALLATSIQLDRQIAEADTVGVVPIKSPDYASRRIALTDPGYVIHPDFALSDFET